MRWTYVCVTQTLILTLRTIKTGYLCARSSRSALPQPLLLTDISWTSTEFRYVISSVYTNQWDAIILNIIFVLRIIRYPVCDTEMGIYSQTSQQKHARGRRVKYGSAELNVGKCPYPHHPIMSMNSFHVLKFDERLNRVKWLCKMASG